MGVIDNAGSKQAFFDWLSTRNTNKYSPSAVVSCIDRISEYVINKKIYHTDFWRIIQPNDFEHLYKKFLDAIPLNTLDTNTYKIFNDMGQLYLNFLTEKPFSNVGANGDDEGMNISITPLSESNDKQEIFQSEKQLDGKQASSDINPEDLIAWLITQPNRNGTLYLESVVRQYINCLRYTPAKLDLPTVDNRNVFSCHTVEELNSLWEVFKSAPNYKDANQRTSGMFSSGLSCLSRYLEYLSGHQENTLAPMPSSKPFPVAIQTNQNPSTSNSALYVNFDRPELCAQTRPVSCTINGEAVISKKLNWSQLLIAIIERLIADGNPHLAKLDKIPLYGRKAFFLPRKADIGNSTLLSNGKWIYTSYNPQTLVEIIANLCRHCDVGLDVVSISFVPKDRPTERSEEQLMRGNANSPALVTTGSVFEPKVLVAVSDVLSAHFPNGFRVDSPIELMRFRNYAADSTDIIPPVDEDLKKAISLCGTLFEGKVYVVGKETESRLKEEIGAAIASGVEVIYYASLYARHESWLFAASVISDEMLKAILKTLYPAYQHKANYFSMKRNNGTEISFIRNEIMRIWAGNTLLSYNQISERLPYIPLDKIKHVLALNGEFIWNSTEVYTHIGIVDISDEERAVIENYVAAACRTIGYASMSDVPLGEIKEHNHELTITAIHNAVFAIALSGKYEKRGKIITRKGDILDALTIMKERFRAVDKCSLQELLDIERDLTGEAYLWIALEVGYTALVRIAEDTFVAEKYVHFDVDKIDETLDTFVRGQYLPLKDITTFAAFPHCGQVWNLFLLESYCRKFSRRYRFEALTVNSRNVGAIVHKSCGLAYPEIIADAVAVSGVELKKKDVLEFLYNSGYIGKKNYSKTDEIIAEAKNIRERRD